jgi:hypothetical protein
VGGTERGNEQAVRKPERVAKLPPICSRADTDAAGPAMASLLKVKLKDDSFREQITNEADDLVAKFFSKKLLELDSFLKEPILGIHDLTRSTQTRISLSLIPFFSPIAMMDWMVPLIRSEG